MASDIVPSHLMKPVPEISCRLQDAIQHGDIDSAAMLASQLARQRPDLCITKAETESIIDNGVRVRIHIEDRNTDAGHLIMRVQPSMTIRLLKEKIFMSLGFVPELQHWIVGRHLAVDDDVLNDLENIDSGLTLYLYLMSARAAGLTRKAYNDKYIDSFVQFTPKSNKSPVCGATRNQTTVKSDFPRQQALSAQHRSSVSRPLPDLPLVTSVSQQQGPYPPRLPGQHPYLGQPPYSQPPNVPLHPYPGQVTPVRMPPVTNMKPLKFAKLQHVTR